MWPNEDKITYIMSHYDEMITELKKKPSLKPFLDMTFAPFPEGEFTVEDVLSMVVRFYIQALQEKEERGFRRYKIQQLFMSIVEDYLPKMDKMHTIEGAYKEIKEQDPDTAITKYRIRKTVTEGYVPSRKAGNKYLVNVAKLLGYFASDSLGTRRKFDEYLKTTSNA